MFKPWLTAAIAMLILLPACASPATQPTTTPTKALVATIAQAVGCHSNGRLPDPNCTPGVVAETEANIVCKRSTDSVRPPMAYTNDLKVKQIILYGYTDTSMSAYEEDHLIPLELGGDPRDPRNLWPEPYPVAYDKDKVENYLHDQVCGGSMPLADAQQAIAVNWEAVLAHIPASPASAPVAPSKPSGVMQPSGSDCPPEAPIKGNRSSMIYHMPDGASYAATKPEACFATEADAQAEGYRRAAR